MDSQNRKRVFISYKSEEYDQAFQLFSVLEENDLDCWMAPISIPGGSNYAAEIETAIRNSDFFVLILSKASMNSIWVEKELNRAFSSHKRVFPFVIECVDLSPSFSFYLSNVQHFPAFKNWDREVNRLLTEIKATQENTDSPRSRMEADRGQTTEKHEPKDKIQQKKRRTSRKVWLIPLIAVLLAVVGTGAYFIHLRMNPEPVLTTDSEDGFSRSDYYLSAKQTISSDDLLLPDHQTFRTEHQSTAAYEPFENFGYCVSYTFGRDELTLTEYYLMTEDASVLQHSVWDKRDANSRPEYRVTVFADDTIQDVVLYIYDGRELAAESFYTGEKLERVEVYDGGLLTQIEYADESVERFTYADERVTESVRMLENGEILGSTKYSYSSRDDTVQKTVYTADHTVSKIITYSGDHVLSEKNGKGKDVSSSTEYTYTQNGLLQEKTKTTPDDDPVTILYKYNAQRKMKRIERRDADDKLIQVVNYTYDEGSLQGIHLRNATDSVVFSVNVKDNYHSVFTYSQVPL